MKQAKWLSVLMAVVMLMTMVEAAVAETESWNCTNCGTEGNTGNFCPHCGIASPTPVPTSTPSPTPESWTCPQCGSVNNEWFCFNCGTRKPTSFIVGDVVVFGHYPQTAKGTDNTPIEWIVLTVDEENNTALLLSKYGLDAQPYDTVNMEGRWISCTLVLWLRTTFMKKAFTAEEQKAIKLTTVDNSANQGYYMWTPRGGGATRDTFDYIFLLSYREANNYLGAINEDWSNKAFRTTLTEYAIAQGAWTVDSSKTEEGKMSGWWWLRSPGLFQFSAATVNSDGALDFGHVYDASISVRPALWVDIDALIF